MSQSDKIESIPAPALNAPASSNTCELWAVDSTCDIYCTSNLLLEPVAKGHEQLNLPTFAFYIHNTRLNKRVLFDNGARKDWWNTPPATCQGIAGKGAVGLNVKHDIHDILVAGGVDPNLVNAVVWSHYHWDHVGNIQLFPKSTDLIAGPGFRETFLPGYPTNKDAFFYEADFEGRNVQELRFDANSPRIGRFQTFDYFGDGSFYLLYTPGHTAGHLSGLVRTTPDTFVFLGGDISHFPGMFRPTPFVPMPENIPAETNLDSRFSHPCPCSIFTACHRNESQGNARTSTFYHVSQSPTSWYEDFNQAQNSVDGLTEFDASENVFVAIAHDPALREVIETFPKSNMNDWKAKGWGKQSHWHFVNELPIDGNPGRPPIVDGIWKHGNHVEI
ncbi:uncharacterized protein Z518_05694 [Rhinocladiella mackenziei CBS 650.93]|uniref:Metallo-beta-lactamase domain-containing protein n=1 Tax=Rhinocladiella mackenziei CBS 650.93 TaxID=1442369 RepID=A0A0D2H315_9EURO|nr:uncharacterized protein Z518_05694 [Rhinocladiella mackenziei CBS 650.93]KIX04823.1 hypothetical protein Z518_05694 [Rhinocladiella mackenziei CBS 650.93]